MIFVQKGKDLLNKNGELRSGCYTKIPNKVTAELQGFVFRLSHSSSTGILVICTFASQFGQL